MAKILCIESSADYCSVCIADGDEVLAATASEETYAHSKYLAVLIKDCIDQSSYALQQMDAIALSAGPGSYTSLRVGASIAKGMCYTAAKPLIVIPSLHIIAQPYLAALQTSQLIIPTIDARRDEAYITVLNGQNEEIEPLQAYIFEEHSFIEYADKGIELIFCGNAADKAGSLISDHKGKSFRQSVPTAKDMVAMAQQSYSSGTFADVAYFQPEYLKSPNITTPKKSLIQ